METDLREPAPRTSVSNLSLTAADAHYTLVITLDLAGLWKFEFWPRDRVSRVDVLVVRTGVGLNDEVARSVLTASTPTTCTSLLESRREFEG